MHPDYDPNWHNQIIGLLEAEFPNPLETELLHSNEQLLFNEVHEGLAILRGLTAEIEERGNKDANATVSIDERSDEGIGKSIHRTVSFD